MQLLEKSGQAECALQRENGNMVPGVDELATSTPHLQENTVTEMNFEMTGRANRMIRIDHQWIHVHEVPHRQAKMQEFK